MPGAVLNLTCSTKEPQEAELPNGEFLTDPTHRAAVVTTFQACETLRECYISPAGGGSCHDGRHPAQPRRRTFNNVNGK